MWSRAYSLVRSTSSRLGLELTIAIVAMFGLAFWIFRVLFSVFLAETELFGSRIHQVRCWNAMGCSDWSEPSRPVEVKKESKRKVGKVIFALPKTSIEAAKPWHTMAFKWLSHRSSFRNWPLSASWSFARVSGRFAPRMCPARC